MARSRILKPEFWTDEIMVELSFAARLWYQGYWTFALCDYGHIDATPKSLKMKIFPADHVDPDELTEELVKWGRVVRKTTPDGRPYQQVGTLSKHTKMDTRWATRCPYCALEGIGRPANPQPSSEEHAQTRAGSVEPTGAQDEEVRGSKGRRGKELTPPLTSFAAPPETDQPADDALIPKPAPKPKPAATKGTRLPEDFTVTDEMVAWARANAPNVHGRIESQKFCNYWWSKTGKDATKVKWELTWRNWMLKAQQDAERNGLNGSRASPKPSTTDQRVNDALALGARMQREADQQKAITG